MDKTIIVAIIGAVSAIIAALIAAWVKPKEQKNDKPINLTEEPKVGKPNQEKDTNPRFSFNSFIAERTERFVGRQFVFKAIDAFLADNDSGYFIIKGEPGIGKSALIAQLVKSRNYIHHFNIAPQGINKSEYFLESIYAQLIARFDLEHSTWPDDAKKSGAFLNQLLTEISNRLRGNEKLVIAIDALDEVDLTGFSVRENVLYLPLQLPQNVFIILTTRLKHDIRLQVMNPTVLSLEANSANNIQDVRNYIQSQLSDKQIEERLVAWSVTKEKFIETILKKSEGNFMYLRHVLPAIKAGEFVKGGIDELPEGLKSYYRSHWAQMKNQNIDTFDKLYRPVVCVLATVKESVTESQIADFTELDPSQISHVINEWREFLHEERDKNHQRLYRIYHTYFQEFLSEEVDTGLLTYHNMIVQYYSKLIGEENK